MSFFQAACSLSDFAFISWKRSRYLKTIRWFFGWSFCVFLSTGFTLTESLDLSFAIVASSLLFWDGELGRLLNFGIRLRSSGNKFLTTSISRNSFCCLGFSEDSKGSTCQTYFRLFAICPTLPEYLLLGVKTLYHASNIAVWLWTSNWPSTLKITWWEGIDFAKFTFSKQCCTIWRGLLCR